MTRVFVAGAMLAVWALCPAQAQQILLPQDLSPENLDITTLQTEQLPSLRRIEPSRRGLVVQEPVESGARAVLRGLDKISGSVTDLDLAVGAQTLFADRLTITLQDCRYPGSDPASNAYAYLTIEDKLRDAPIFEGWMIAASPALNALDHARYDVWVLRCTTTSSGDGNG